MRMAAISSSLIQRKNSGPVVILKQNRKDINVVQPILASALFLFLFPNIRANEPVRRLNQCIQLTSSTTAEIVDLPAKCSSLYNHQTQVSPNMFVGLPRV